MAAPWQELQRQQRALASGALVGHGGRSFHCSFAPHAVRGRVGIHGAQDSNERVAADDDGSRGGCAADHPPLLLTSSEDGAAMIWDVRGLKPLMRLEGHSDEVLRAAWAAEAGASAAEPIVATAGSDATVRVWDVGGHEARCLAVFNHITGTATIGDDDGDGDGSDAAAPDTEEGVHQVYAVKWGRGRLLGSLLTASENQVHVWELATARRIISYDFDAAEQEQAVVHGGKRNEAETCYVFDLATCANDLILMTAMGDGSVRVRDAREETGWSRDTRTILAHQRFCTSCAIADDGRVAVSAGGDGTLCVWDASSWSCMAKIEQAHAGPVYGAGFWPQQPLPVPGSGELAPELREIVVFSWSADGSMQFWRVGDDGSSGKEGEGGTDAAEPSSSGGDDSSDPKMSVSALGSFTHNRFPMLCCAAQADLPEATTGAADGLVQAQDQGSRGPGQIWVARAGGRSDEKDPNQPIWIHKIPLRDDSSCNVDSGAGTVQGETDGTDEADQEYLLQAAALLGE